MSISSKTTKIATLIAIITIAGFFIYKGTAGPMKIITTGSSTVKIVSGLTSAKINMPDTNRLTSGLVGYWTMDGQDTNWGTNTTNDRSGNSNTGTMTNMATTTSPVPGVAGQGMYFDGINDLINVDQVDLYDNIPTISVSLWFKINQLSSVKGENQVLIRKRHSSTPFSSWIMRLSSSNDKLGFVVINSSATTVTEESDSALETRRWYHAVGVYDGSNMTLYMDGIVASSPSSQTGTIYNSNSTLFIGATDVSLLRTNGTIDEVRVYNRVLSQAEITELYNMGR